ncbi:MAG: homocysteine S-methyltransferase family protein [Clostridiales Family XIII bacterium]|jgi:5-methyltetrahydrofolate--homocysteine methyltransferase|nr:homocysteine S-methyltransferase family protein [Clostridiales Family XIII bacterium]
MRITELLGNRIVLFDGAMGTAFQSAGLSGGELPLYNIERPDVVQAVHRDYLKAGSDILSANTFEANGLKLAGSGHTVREVIAAAMRNCKAVIDDFGGGAFAALDIGPSGKLMDMGDGFDFDAAYELYREQVVAGAESGADLILFETFSDIVELKAGVLAAKEHADLPVFCSLTFEGNGRTLMGTDPVTAVRMFQDMGVDAVGVNCSLGPEGMLPLIREMAAVSKIPVLAQPNAGLPQIRDGVTRYDVDAGAFTDCMTEILESGAAAIGGCCGTDPSYIEMLSARLAKADDAEQRERFPALRGDWRAKKVVDSAPSACAVTGSVVMDGRARIIGDRLDPARNGEFAEALRAGNDAYTVKEALEQARAGADIVLVRADLPGVDEEEALLRLVRRISAKGKIPLMIECGTPAHAERAAKYCRGKVILGAVDGRRASMDAYFPIAAKYGLAVVVRTRDETGIPADAASRFAILERLLAEAGKYGIGKDRILADASPPAASGGSEAENAAEASEAAAQTEERFGVRATARAFARRNDHGTTELG